jgi:hypothetical protein
MIKQTIGEDAGKIWQKLNSENEKPIKELAKELRLKEKDFYMAIGWLARENKIGFYEENNQQIVFLVD